MELSGAFNSPHFTKFLLGCKFHKFHLVVVVVSCITFFCVFMFFVHVFWCRRGPGEGVMVIQGVQLPAAAVAVKVESMTS